MAAVLILCSDENACNSLGDRMRLLMDCGVLTAEKARAALEESHREGSYTVVLDARLLDPSGLDNDGLPQKVREESHLTPQAAHSLRSPLNSIIGMAELIQKHFFGGLNEKQTEFAKVIVRSGYQLLEAIDKLEMNDV